jgi:hypothetical protein
LGTASILISGILNNCFNNFIRNWNVR